MYPSSFIITYNVHILRDEVFFFFFWIKRHALFADREQKGQKNLKP